MGRLSFWLLGLAQIQSDINSYVNSFGLQSNQVKRTPQEYINEFIIQKLNPLLVVAFRLISAFLHV